MVYYNNNKKILNKKRTELYKLKKDTPEYKLKKHEYYKNYIFKQRAKLI